jgi:hypothetical protein
MSCQYVRAAYAPDTVAAVLDLAIGAVEMLAVRPDAVVDDLAGLDSRAR